MGGYIGKTEYGNPPSNVRIEEASLPGLRGS